MKVKCKECGHEYNLKDDENPEDYTCECGGELRVMKRGSTVPVLEGSIFLILLYVSTVDVADRMSGHMEWVLTFITLILPIILILAIIYRKRNPPLLIIAEGILFSLLGGILLWHSNSIFRFLLGATTFILGILSSVEGIMMKQDTV
ncbi:hypothetical protein [Methanothermobacter sp. K4]|uniref:hypothetical protein n=1 Tax=Methanothermobacter sp. K4 TaxID=2913262 RepID=UPI001EDB110D|nr:hypothetical protein [Methanothermobacter sp. K4]MCG2829071.1 hypothetical protein [Methanothermobacter sp. K4]